ncbi:Cysteine oxygenase/2-aminoethanethiol dioxygenase [Dillenia turbinata]|uniref:cysteine dioxygenase n=1 Tax=Dillenia turbinata TaxID=194707 RepID=A0AAN8UWL6_9MAGN
MSSAVQNLYESCKEIFATNTGAGFIPSPSDVDRLRLVLDDMKVSDVGLDPERPYFATTYTGTPLITYLHLYECEKFQIGIFCLPPSGVIPLHNHPGMTVFSKLLFGSMHVKSYDWVAELPDIGDSNLNPSHFRPPGVCLAKVETNSIFTAPCNTFVLYPAAGGNMHSFTALTSCAVLDVLGPPYSDAEGRPCRYFSEFPYISFSGDLCLVPQRYEEGYAWLEERDRPEDFLAVRGIYMGPKIVEN